MTRKPFLIVSIAALATAIVAITWYLSQTTVTLDPRIPKSEPLAMPAPPPSLTTVTVPISIRLPVIRSFLDNKIPSIFAGSSKTEVVDKLDMTASANWHLTRSALLLSGEEGKLNGTIKLTGPVRVAAHLGPACTSATVNLRGSISVSAQPNLREDWHLIVPDLQLHATLNDALVYVSLPVTRMVPIEVIDKIPIVKDLPLIGAILSGFKKVVRTVLKPVEDITKFPVSVRSIVRKYLEPEITDLRDDMVTDIASADFLRKSAEKYWSRLCTSVPIETGLWLQIKPIHARVLQPRISENRILLQLGIDAETQVVSKHTEPSCPFPEFLTLESSGSGRIDINLPAEVDYLVIRKGLSDLLVGNSFGDVVSVRVNDVIEVGAVGGSLMLGLAVTVDTGGWFRSRAAGTV